MDVTADHIWQSTVVATVAAALVCVFRQNRASIRHAIWLAASMKFMVPFAVLTAAVAVLPWPAAVPPDSRAVVAVTAIFSASALPAVSGTLSRVLVAVWFIGTVVVLARWAREWTRLKACVRGATLATEGTVFDAVRRAERAAGIGTPTRILISDREIEPGVIGLWKPVLVWPRVLTHALTVDRVEAIVAHEMAHVKRRDNLLASMHMLVSAVFWFHPMVWWIGARLVDERERACDEEVLALGHSPDAYAAGIVKTCELCVAVPIANVAAISGGELKDRLRRIVCHTPHPPLGPAKVAALVCAVLAVLTVPIVGGSGAIARGAAAQNADASKPERVGPGIEPPRLRKEVKPQYTARAIAEKIEGEVLMECVIKADGTVGDITITKSLDPDLDQAAIDAARLWEFDPATRKGKPVAVLVTIEMAFTLKGERAR